MSWYMLNELFKISDEARRFKIQNDIERIKEMICESNTIEDQFRYFIPILEFEEQGLSPDDIEWESGMHLIYWLVNVIIIFL